MRYRAAVRLASGAVLAILMAGTQVLAPSAQAGKTSSITYSGNANVAEAHLLNNAINVGPISDTGPLPSGGGYIEKDLITVNVNEPPPPSSQISLSAEVAQAITAGSGNEAHSQASVAVVDLALGSPPSLTIHADVLQANSHAICKDGVATTSGEADIATLVINGQKISAAAPANTKIDLSPLAIVWLNKQTASSSGNSAAIDVNALEVDLLPGNPDFAGSVVISHAHSDINNCPPSNPPPPPPPCPVLDFVTGGGYITYNGGTKVTFSVNGGMKQNGLQGHLNIIDHGTGQHIQASTLTGYTGSGNTRTLTFTDGSGNTYTVTVTDNGEPGTNDTFSVSGPYSKSGQLGPGTAGGGNIQLHQPSGCQSGNHGKGH